MTLKWSDARADSSRMTNSSSTDDEVAEIARTARFFRRLATLMLALVACAALTFSAVKFNEHRANERHKQWVECSFPSAAIAELADCDRRFK
jgi:hypothetical protein